MEPEPGNPLEVEGVMNPAVVRGRDGQLYLFPRLVARGNYSRIGIARVQFNAVGDPTGVERLGIALEPEADYELRPDGGGCEDPRITYIEPIQRYVMNYTAFSRDGPRIALAVSDNLFHWQRLGLVTFRPYQGIEFDGVDNKDAAVFPLRHSRSNWATCNSHPPPAAVSRDSPGRNWRATLRRARSIVIERASGFPIVQRPSRICSHISSAILVRITGWLVRWRHGSASRSASAPPPILTRHGWLVVYHGVDEAGEPTTEGRRLRYSAGVMILSEEHPHVILYRSPQPVLTPDLPQERQGPSPTSCFPPASTGATIWLSDRFDVYYGMADNRIGGRTLTCRKSCRQGLPPTAWKKALTETKNRREHMPDYTYLIIGGGMTGDAALHGIREVDRTGSIGVIGSEPHLPYNRPPLSKALWKGKPLDSVYRKDDEPGVTFHFGRIARKLDLQISALLITR